MKAMGMPIFFFLILLLLLGAAHGVHQSFINGDIAMPGEESSWSVEEILEVDETDGEAFDEGGWSSEGMERVLVNVDAFGAAGDGVSDDTQAFEKAWESACSMDRTVLLVPQERKYLVKATTFRGPCGKGLTIEIKGTIVAPEDPDEWDKQSPTRWLRFFGLNGFTLEGDGLLDGLGQKWWAQSCKINKTMPCAQAPTALTIDSSKRVRVKDLKIQNSQQMHFAVTRCEEVRISNLQIESPQSSPNTDGIHITSSTNVVIQSCDIATGDDCISISNGTSNLRMKEIRCGPGHGISIGSLGKDNSTAMVTGIVLDTATLQETTNGLRIKTWQGGAGSVTAVLFQNVNMNDVANPIIIDQFYCDSKPPCRNQTSAVKISKVMYRNIRGTSKTPEAMKFACSDSVPCINIFLENIDLEVKDGTAETFCNCAMGIDHGTVNPPADCLRDTTCGGGNKREGLPGESSNSIHTEL